MVRYPVDHSLDRIAWIAPDGRFLYANKAACKEVHYTLEQVLSMGVPDVDPGFPQETWDKHYQHVKEVGSIRLEVQQIDGRGKTHHIDVATTYNSFGGNEFICSFARDITELRNAEHDLKEQMAFIDLISRLSATFIHIKAADIDSTIEQGLGLITESLGVQRSNLFQCSKNRQCLCWLKPLQ
jgi:PAS domain S-box-containing protein